VGWGLLVAGVAGLVLLGNAPSPYVIEQPGPVFDTLGTARTTDGGEAELITIDGADTYDTEGELDLLTVSVVGSRTSPVDWFEIAQAWFDPSKAVIPVDLVYPPEQSQSEVDQQNAAAMTDSQQEAIAAALGELGYTFPSEVGVGFVVTDSAADGVLEVGDRILTIDGEPVTLASDVRAAVVANGTERAMTLEIVRDGVTQDIELTPRPVDNGDGTTTPLIGIGVSATYVFPFDVEIRLDDVGGPSAGQMFALGVYDKLTPGALTGGEHVAGTGTIDAAGEVGAIGGIVQKMYGARAAGAEWFLAPASNCDEVVGHVPDGLTVFSVETLDDSLAALEAIAEGSDTSALPTCTAG